MSDDEQITSDQTRFERRKSSISSTLIHEVKVYIIPTTDTAGEVAYCKPGTNFKVTGEELEILL